MLLTSSHREMKPWQSIQNGTWTVTSLLSRNKLNLNGIFLTHPHADFVAGHAELSARSGAPILVSDKAPATFIHRDVKEGDRVTLGTLEIEVMATPGRSPASICLCLF